MEHLVTLRALALITTATIILCLASCTHDDTDPLPTPEQPPEEWTDTVIYF